MATRKRRRRMKKLSPKTAANTKESLNAKVELLTSEDTPVYYSNFAEIAHGHHEIALYFARLPTKLPKDKIEMLKKGAPLTEVAALQVIVPPTILPGLIRALTIQREKYEAQFGKLSDLGAPDVS